ncbi:hypothetical protein [Companilactobacillus halodurans]|uniref:Uncharacterized protein n=1 Tax=Companilactobacillus halodurans TaxID=2584183 RepID=A0A5P1A1B7_9LACO|nr:hypothetical protein [Companilactobacillus halodurans]MQS98608.1 hypothetical protein [Companilactobacillus halodurans]
MSSFGSFLVCEKGLPDNEQIKKDFEQDDIKPNKLREKYDLDLKFKEDFLTDSGEGQNKFNRDFMFVALNVAARANEQLVTGWKNFHENPINNKRDQNMVKLYLQINDPKFRGCYATDVIKRVVDSDSSNVANDFFASRKKDKSLIFVDDSKKLDEKRAKQYIAWDKAKQAKSKKGTRKYHDLDESPDVRKNNIEVFKAIEDNREIFQKSANIFVEEWKIIQPKHLVLFGGTARKLLVSMKETDAFKKYPELCQLVDDSIGVYHYSYFGINFEKWFTTQCKDLNDKIVKKGW